MRLFGLIGNPLAQSFSKKYFADKFEKEKIFDAEYQLFPLADIADFKDLLLQQPSLAGINVTIPYKEQVLIYLNELSNETREIGACNCIKITSDTLKGYNTDAPAFKKSLLHQLQPHHNKALILGTGGASKAVEFVLRELGINYKLVSRYSNKGILYEDITNDIIQEFPLIINTTPLGSFPKTNTTPDIPYQYLSSKNYLYDLVYNPEKTLFLQRGAECGALIKNGYEMLVEQAELSWKIWND